MYISGALVAFIVGLFITLLVEGRKQANKPKAAQDGPLIFFCSCIINSFGYAIFSWLGLLWAIRVWIVAKDS